ncbi:MAG: tetratricopeptide repeat protein [Spirochaetes bacterium]|nr:MAG: tetratricopeptide repeat protein [Spirochaetota bacterium]
MNVYRTQRRLLTGLLAFALVLGMGAQFQAAEKNAIYYNKVAKEFLDKGDTYRAIINYKNALRQNARFKEALLGLGQAYLLTEGYEEAQKLFTEVLALDRENQDAMTGMGFSMVRTGNYTEALKFFEKAVALAEDNLEAQYGIAFVYYRMDRRIWAKRKLEGILRVNPYHIRSLLLTAEIKTEDGRLSEAKKLIDKAIDADRDSPEGYAGAGRIYFKFYAKNGDGDYLDDAVAQFGKAVARGPEHPQANRYLGHISYMRGKFDKAQQYYQRVLTAWPENAAILYNLGISYEKAGDNGNALSSFLKALERMPSDDALQAKVEDFLVMGAYKIGNPQRVGFSNEHVKRSLKKMRENLSEEAIMHLRRALYLNPVNREAREKLRDYYATMNYYQFFLDEIKELARIFPEGGFEDPLHIAVIKKRERLYFREGYADEPVTRDVPGILIMNLSANGELTAHPDLGEEIANYVTFALGQLGRQDAVRIKRRIEISKELRDGEGFTGDNLDKLAKMARKGDIKGLRYVVFGGYREGDGFISGNFRVMDFKTGVIIDEFALRESGKDNLSRLAMRAANRIYAAVPYEGRILKLNEESVVVNLGLFDGLKAGDYLTTFRYEPSANSDKINMKRKILFTVAEADTLVSSAKPQMLADLERVDVNDTIYPLKKRRAKMIK